MGVKHQKKLSLFVNGFFLPEKIQKFDIKMNKEFFFTSIQMAGLVNLRECSTNCFNDWICYSLLFHHKIIFNTFV